jgi:hypothetical protein
VLVQAPQIQLIGPPVTIGLDANGRVRDRALGFGFARHVLSDDYVLIFPGFVYRDHQSLESDPNGVAAL